MTVTSATSSLAVGKSSADNGTAASKTSAADPQDRFLQLLVAQLNNQDPMNPMDNAQMTSQIAQINTVTGIQQLNTTMQNMASQMSAMQVLQAGNLVGRNVVAVGDRLTLDSDGKTAVGALQLDGKASDVKIQVMTAGGQVLETLSLGALSAGQHGFSLDASKYPSGTELHFKVQATNGADAVGSTALMRDTVVAVGSDSAGLSLTLAHAGATPYANVRSVL